MEQSKLHANLPYLLGLPHDESGEKIHLQKIKVLIEDLGFNPQVEDLQSFIPGDLAKFGYANYALIESKQTPIVLPHSIDLRESSIWVVAHAIGIAAARGLTFKGKKSLSYKFQVHHLEEKVNCDLYKNANYLFTESLLINRQLILYDFLLTFPPFIISINISADFIPISFNGKLIVVIMGL